jgi:hypothetical protein
VTIDMPPEMEQQLDDLARQRGTTPESLVRSAVEKLLAPVETECDKPAPGSLAELLQGYAGVFDSREWVTGGARLSENTAEKFTDILVEKRAQGHL